MEPLQYTVGKSQISIGKFTYGYDKISIKEWNEGNSLTIGKFCSIAKPTTIFLGGNHRTDWISTFPFGHVSRKELGSFDIVGNPYSNGDVIIENDVWLCSGATILSGISIGNGAVIAANSTVVKDVRPYEIVGGNPAKHIKFRFKESIRKLLLELKWWDLPIDDIQQLAVTLSSPPTEELLLSLIQRFKND